MATAAGHHGSRVAKLTLLCKNREVTLIVVMLFTMVYISSLSSFILETS